MKCTIYLIRHGKTTWNDPKTKKFTGWCDVGLSAEGVVQAEKVSTMLKKANISVGYCSSLKRSRDTLSIFLKNHPGAKKKLDNRIIERSYGKLSGKLHQDILNKFGKEQYVKWHRGFDEEIPGGESIKEVERRAYAFATDLLEDLKKNPKNVVISGHNNSLRAMRGFFEELTIKEEMALNNAQDDYVSYVYDTENDVLAITRNGAGHKKKVKIWTSKTKPGLISP
jgi:2,3-bisphosphoglycerate-dependent phosphoglycerate mutase